MTETETQGRHGILKYEWFLGAKDLAAVYDGFETAEEACDWATGRFDEREWEYIEIVNGASYKTAKEVEAEKVKAQLASMIGELAGYASVCWTEGTRGVFESERVVEALDKTVNLIYDSLIKVK